MGEFSAPTKLELIADQERLTLEAKNLYNPDGKNYSASNKNALSDGDDKGKGELDGSIGSKTDIQTRQELLLKSSGNLIRYNEQNQYNENNPNALSDGDDRGKGQIDDFGTIGSKTDIQTRQELLLKSSGDLIRYNEKNQYGQSNPNALSDGDEYGKGQIGDTGTVGSKTDIKTRKDLLGKSSGNLIRYSERRPYYPELKNDE